VTIRRLALIMVLCCCALLTLPTDSTQHAHASTVQDTPVFARRAAEAVVDMAMYSLEDPKIANEEELLDVADPASVSLTASACVLSLCPWSGCIGSGCITSGCLGSMCVSSGCTSSICFQSGCVSCGTSTSCSTDSACTSMCVTVCYDSQCRASLCENPPEAGCDSPALMPTEKDSRLR
jgi:hypothetical protein